MEGGGLFDLYSVFMEADSSVGVKSIEWANLTSALQTLAIATFNVKTFRKPVCRVVGNFLIVVCCCTAEADPPILLVSYNVRSSSVVLQA